jgi:hypothetical protein
LRCPRARARRRWPSTVPHARRGRSVLVDSYPRLRPALRPPSRTAARTGRRAARTLVVSQTKTQGSRERGHGGIGGPLVGLGTTTRPPQHVLVRAGRGRSGAGASLLAGSPTPRTRLVTHVTEIDRAGVAWARCRRDGTDRSHLISSARDFSSSGRSVPCPRPDPSDTQMQRKQAGGSHQPGRAESTPTKRPLPVRTSEQVSLSISAAPSSYVV